MMNRFTERAQEALQRAQQIMFAKQHTQLDVEHIFLALLQQRNSLSAQIISRLGGNVQTMMNRLESALDNMQDYNAGRGTARGYITLRASRVLQGAAEHADRLGDDFIGTEHLLLAIANERYGATYRIMQEVGIDQEKIYAVLRDIRGDESLGENWSQPTDSWQARTIINPPTLAKPVGFNHGILTDGGRLLFLAGQTATDAEGKVVSPNDVVAQYRQVLDNLKQVVEEAGGQMADIVKMTIFVKDRDDYRSHLKQLGLVHKSYFGDYYPSTALLEVSRFFEDGVLVEIEGIAVIGT